MPDPTIIPAVYGTVMVFTDPGRYPQPVVAWNVTPAQAFPITPFARASVTAGEAICFFPPESDSAEAWVYDLVWKKVFPSVDAWRDAVAVERPYEIGAVPGAAAGRPASTPRSEAPAAARGPAVPGVVQFTGKLYERKSFWKIGDGLVVLEPGEPTPVGPGVAKITREAFDQAKKAGAQLLDREPAPELGVVLGEVSFPIEDEGDPLNPEERDDQERHAESMPEDDDDLDGLV